ncbi:unnamed protein product [Adineta steineri]|uniref:Uncharacterized protein n=1 Tax=Adineta steineri TaxID=433720 RepID=A0A813YRK4_9BILA|nr:unnamed protein product [Adineta steineri]CAF1164568.1 unnamed protein product [Adineta steineri]
MASSNKFIKHFRDLQAGESEKAGAAETLAYLNGELSFQEYEKRVREVNTDYSNVSVGKVLNTREAEIVDIDKLIDELSDIDDLSLSGLSSNTSDNSEDSQHDNEPRKKKKTEIESKSKRRQRKKQQQQQDSDEDEGTDDESEEKFTDPNEIRNKMVQHLEEIHLANQKRKRKRTNKSKRSTTKKRSLSTSEKVPKSRLNQEYQALMGEANMAYVHGDIPKALRICQEVITNVPNAGEPYITLARIYDDQNEHDKAFEMNLVAAHCQRSKDLWIRMLTECQQRKADNLLTDDWYQKAFELKFCTQLGDT